MSFLENNDILASGSTSMESRRAQACIIFLKNGIPANWNHSDRISVRSRLFLSEKRLSGHIVSVGRLLGDSGRQLRFM